MPSATIAHVSSRKESSLVAACTQKAFGAYYTPPDVVAELVNWAVRSTDDLLVDPACGDGRFLAIHRRSVGIEQDVSVISAAHAKAPHERIVVGDFFEWINQANPNSTARVIHR